MKTLGKVIAIICALLVLLVTALQIVLNRPFVSRLADRYASEYIDGDLEFSGMHFSVIRNFPGLRVTLDTLSVTYPRWKFSEYDKAPVRSRLLDAGKGADTDTLLRFDRFTASVNPFRLLSGRIRLNDARMYGLSVYAHQYDTTANWSIFGAPRKPEKDTVDAPLSLPWISVGEVLVKDTKLIYTNQMDTVFVAAGADRLCVSGRFRTGGDEGFRLKKASFRLDSLRAHGRFPADTLAAALDYLYVDNQVRQVFNVGMGASLTAFSSSFGRLKIPAELKAVLDIDRKPRRMKVEMPMLRAELAHIPLEAQGTLWRTDDSTRIRMHCSIDDCDLGEILEEYGPSINALASDVSTNARLSLEADADGYLSGGRIPSVSATLRIPSSRVYYKPKDLMASLDVDAVGSTTPEKYVRAGIRKLALSTSGLDLDVTGNAKDLLGSNPAFDVHATGHAIADSLKKFFPEDAGFEAGGDVAIRLDAKTDKEELTTYRFRKSDIYGEVLSGFLSFSMPEDTLKARAHNSAIRLTSGRDGLNITADLDSAIVDKGTELRASVRKMENAFRMYKVDSHGTSVPRLTFNTSHRSIFVKAGTNRIGLFGTKIGAAMQMRAIDNRKELIRHFIDSLQRVYPGVPKDSLLIVAMGGRQSSDVPSYMKEDDFSKRDISIKLDSTITKYLKQWKPSGSIEIARGFFSTPALPLRTRIKGFSGRFTDNEIVLDSINVVSGTSDVSARGEVSGLRRVIFGKGLIKTNLDIKAGRVNLNEIFVALDKGKTTVETDVNSETEGSFVVDSIADARATVDMIPMAVVPGNLDAVVTMSAGDVELMDFTASNAVANVKIKDRVLQLTDAEASTNLGYAGVNAFFSTKSWDDMSMGADLRLRDISAAGIIRMLPKVDDMLPALKSFDGKLALDLSVTSQLDSSLNVVVPSVDGIMRISGKDLMISDAGNLRRVTGLLGFKNKNIGHIDDLAVDAVVHDSKLEVFPFELSVDRYKLALRGSQGYDKSMNYHISVLKSPFLIPFGINIYGYTYNWRFLLGFAKYREGKVPVYTEQLDNMQINVLQSIRDVFNRGVDKARKQIRESGSEMYSNVAGSGQALPADGDYASLDSLSLEMAMAAADAELDAEVEEALSSSIIDLDMLVRDYEATTDDKFINLRMEQLKKKD